MSLSSDVKLLSQQAYPRVDQDGVQSQIQQSVLGEIFTADWKQRLLRAGFLYRLTVGTITVDVNVARVTGGGDGTFIELEQPEIGIGVPAGYFLIPVEIKIGCQVHLNSDNDDASIIATTDRTQNIPSLSGITHVAEVPVNMLDGQRSFPGTAISAVETDLTTPVVSEILDYETIKGSAAGTVASLSAIHLKMNYQPLVPSVVAGPCAIYAYWGGQAGVGAIATVVFGCVPSSYYPLS